MQSADISSYIQQEGACPEIFSEIGHLVASLDVHHSLGAAITSAAGDLWWIARTNGAVVAFATARPLKSSPRWHIRFVWALEDDAHALAAMIAAIVKDAKEQGVESLYTNDRLSAKHWAKAKFTMQESTARRGDFRRWELILRKRRGNGK